MKNYAPKTLKEVVREINKIDKKMADYIGMSFSQSNYENGINEENNSHSWAGGSLRPDSIGPLDFFSWRVPNGFTSEEFEKRNKQLNKIFKKKKKEKKKKDELNKINMYIDCTGCNPEIAIFLKKH